MTGSNPQSPIPNRQSGLAPYAVADQASRGRVHPETLPADESPFELDRSRILNCMAFRRLMHKTQVFVTESGDHFRTRLTHTIEVAAQAQRLARPLGLNARLACAIALAHDLGHPPFGHAGEAALAALMKDHGGFEHNIQSLRVVDYLEHPYPPFRGLNLTFEVRESLIKHHTLHDRPDPSAAIDEQARLLLDAGPMPPLEGQVVSLADTIAYTLHDIEDGLVECGLTEEALSCCAVWREAAQPVREKHASGPVHAIRRPILDNIARRLAEDAVAESRRRLDAAHAADPNAVRRNNTELVAFSDKVRTGIEELQALLAESVYGNHRVVRMDSKARRLIRQIFEAYLAEPELLPQRFGARIQDQGRHRVICDYIAGMTDRFCQQEHCRLHAPFEFG
ncbi:MAG: dNTP triphosphohydrolase [Phycisphaerae bacterium]|nr:dNTP triphosphohydrolase [Phycisphaerae bacterium]